MFNSKKQPPIKSLIAHGSRIDGNYSFSEGLRVDGELVGNIVAQPDHTSLLVISETAVIQGEVRAHHIIINGSVTGPIHASFLLELQPKARIVGDVEYMALEMHQGATIAGQLRPLMQDAEKPTLTLAASNG